MPAVCSPAATTLFAHGSERSDSKTGTRTLCFPDTTRLVTRCGLVTGPLTLGVATLGTGYEVSESEGVISKLVVSFSCTLLPPLRRRHAHSLPAHLVSFGEEEVGRGPDGDRSQHHACTREGLVLSRSPHHSFT